eukprot:gene4638-2828_t
MRRVELREADVVPQMRHPDERVTAPAEHAPASTRWCGWRAARARARARRAYALPEASDRRCAPPLWARAVPKGRTDGARGGRRRAAPSFAARRCALTDHRTTVP